MMATTLSLRTNAHSNHDHVEYPCGVTSPRLQRFTDLLGLSGPTREVLPPRLLRRWAIAARVGIPHMLEDGIDTSGEGLSDSEGNLKAKASPSYCRQARKKSKVAVWPMAIILVGREWNMGIHGRA